MVLSFADYIRFALSLIALTSSRLFSLFSKIGYKSISISCSFVGIAIFITSIVLVNYIFKAKVYLVVCMVSFSWGAVKIRFLSSLIF